MWDFERPARARRMEAYVIHPTEARLARAAGAPRGRARRAPLRPLPSTSGRGGGRPPALTLLPHAHPALHLLTSMRLLTHDDARNFDEVRQVRGSGWFVRADGVCSSLKAGAVRRSGGEMSKDADTFDNRFKILLTGDRSRAAPPPAVPVHSALCAQLSRNVPRMTEGRRGLRGA